ncbi:hypothetical protein ACIBCU_24065 [Streptomyces sp. NPDC051064]|uniref:hypothetical protein n=1 Tax=Streptomyces sp. NPDC051064 TaxID=3365641 RepID=UPI0037BD59AB
MNLPAPVLVREPTPIRPGRPPLRFPASADAIEGATAKAQELLARPNASRKLGGHRGQDA